MKPREKLMVPTNNRYRLMSDANRRRIDDFVVHSVTKLVKSRNDGGSPAARYLRNAMVRAFQVMMRDVKEGVPLMPFSEFHRLVATNVRGQNSFDVFTSFERNYAAVPQMVAWLTRFYSVFFTLQHTLAMPIDRDISRFYDAAAGRDYMRSDFARHRGSKRATAIRYASRVVANMLSLVIMPEGFKDKFTDREAAYYLMQIAERTGTLSKAARSLLREAEGLSGSPMTDRFALLATGALCASDEASLVSATFDVMRLYFEDGLPVPASFTDAAARLAPYRRVRTVTAPYMTRRTKEERAITEEAKAIEARRRAIRNARYKAEKQKRDDEATGRTMLNELEF